MMETNAMKRNTSKSNINEFKDVKPVGSAPNSDKNNKKAGDKIVKDLEPRHFYDGPSTPNQNGQFRGKDDSTSYQIAHTHMASHDSSQLQGQFENMAHTHGGSTNQTSQSANRHLSNKSDTNLNGNILPANVNGATNNLVKFEKVKKEKSSDANKKRKLSEKQTNRRASNNKREKEHAFAMNEGGERTQGQSGQPRSTSKGNNIKTYGYPAQAFNNDASKAPQFVTSSLFDQTNFNPFSGGFGQTNQNQTFQFSAPGNGAFITGGQAAPQVHFIARKQQFIAQISPEQLIGSDKRPYTAQSLNNLTGGSTKKMGMKPVAAPYGFANAAFSNQAQIYLGQLGSKTHTSGFNYQPQKDTKFSPNVYGDDFKGKSGGKDLIKQLNSSNGFTSSAYNNDPYNSVLTSSLPSTFQGNKQKQIKQLQQQNKSGGKEKEQLYDETIKMKMLNNQLKEEHVKMKTKIKMLENELNRKERTIEDLFNHNQIIQQTQSKLQSGNNSTMLPLAQATQKYQQETFLVMSLKKQIRELKFEVVKRDEELEVLRKNIRNTRTIEFEQELQQYNEECQRLRGIVEELLQQGQSHPLHNQTMVDRVNELEELLKQKDQMIQQISEGRKSQVRLNDGDEVSSQVNPGPTAPFKNSESQQFESQASDVGGVSGSQSAHAQAMLERSQDRKSAPGSGPQMPKDLQRELQRAKKTLKEKDKDLLKMKTEVSQLRKEIEKAKSNEQAQNKDVETQIKALKDKLLLQKGEARRKDEKISEVETQKKKLEDQIQSLNETLKQQEDNNKSLKAQLRTAKHKVKTATEANTTPQLNSSFVQHSSDASKDKHHEPAQNSIPDKTATSTKTLETMPETKTEVSEKADKAEKKDVPPVPKEELALITLIGQREKLCRDDLTAMMLSGEDSLRMLIKEPSDALINYIKAYLHDEDALLAGIPRYEIPKTDFERQVLREMRIVLRANAQLIADKTKEELMPWPQFVEIYKSLENFEYPHKDKLLEFIKYFFLDHIVSKNLVLLNFLAFKDHLLAARGQNSPTKTRNTSLLRSERKSVESSQSRGEKERDVSGSAERGRTGKIVNTNGSDIDDERIHDEERMLDIAEQCFMRIADLLHMNQKTVRQAFLKYSQPELFKDGSVLELLSPRGFLEGVRDIGFDDVTELEAACLMKVLAKPELENSVILNEFMIIMENFGIPVISEEEEYENDYIPDIQSAKEEKKDTIDSSKDVDSKHRKFAESKKNLINLKFDVLDEKGHKILKKLARFLLERYMHPREFFGPTVKKEVLGKNKCKVEVIKLHDFYLRIKLASIRKKLKENQTLNQFLAIDGDKFPGFVQVRRMIKALEIIAEKEQEIMIKEEQEKIKEHKEKMAKFAEERASQGLPPLSDDELDKLINPPKEDKDKKDSAKGKSKDYSENGKKTRGELEGVIRIGGKRSGDKERSRFASANGPAAQLNTIEEDLQETQTSHYSYHVKEGEHSDRDGSKHQLSTHLRNSHAPDFDESSRRSNNGKGTQLLGASVNSGDLSGGSFSSNKKRKTKDIDEGNIQIADFKDFRKKRSADPKMNSQDRSIKTVSDMRKYSIKEELNEDDQYPQPQMTQSAIGIHTDVRHSLAENTNNIVLSHKASKASKLLMEEDSYSDKDYEMDYELDNDEFEQRMKEEVNKKIKQQLPHANFSQEPSHDDHTHDSGERLKENSNVNQTADDTVRTSKIQEVLKTQENYSDDERYSQDEMVDVKPKNKKSEKQSQRDSATGPASQIRNKKNEVEIEEDYEF